MTTVNSFLLLSFRQFAFSNCSGNYLWFSFAFEYTTISYSHLMNDSRHWCGFFSQFSCSGRKKMALARRYNKWIANIKLYTPSHFSKVYKIEILQPVYQQVAVKMGQVWCLSLSHSLFLLLNLFVCLFFSSAFFLFVIWLVVSPPLPQQGQEYAALGALVNDDEPLSSPPGSTEMELKVKQVCPDTVTCWELVQNDSCNLVTFGFLKAF